jgi:nitrogen fixation protein FixH
VKKGLQWPIGVVVVLTLTVAGNIYIAVRANDDPSVHIEKDYYQKAVRFDADQALQKRSDRLGWHLTLAASRTTAANAAVTATLVDSTGTAVHGALVRLSARAVARANDSFTATAVETGDSYVATLPMGRRGLWDVSVEVVRGAERFVTTQRLDLPESR